MFVHTFQNSRSKKKYIKFPERKKKAYTNWPSLVILTFSKTILKIVRKYFPNFERKKSILSLFLYLLLCGVLVAACRI